MTNISGSMIGDAIQKAITGANGTPAPSSAAISGITPQEQNGEMAPTSAASRVARNGWPLKASAIRLSGAWFVNVSWATLVLSPSFGC